MKLALCFEILLLVIAGIPSEVRAQEGTNQPARSLPGQLKVVPPTQEPIAAPPVSPPSFQGITRPMVLPASPAHELTDGILVFDREVAETSVTDGAPEARFFFSFTNVSSANLTITNVALSCGCTAVELPPLPWVLKPGESGRLPVTLEVAGKSGVVAKSLQVRTDRGVKTIIVKADVPPPADGE